METLKYIIVLQAFFGLAAIGVLVYLVIRRIRIRKKESFEKRNN
jgi:phage shock protein PspC (stress-responsive transcriptional regulator)